jgi:hypothetical protein
MSFDWVLPIISKRVSARAKVDEMPTRAFQSRRAKSKLTLRP